ncbi:small EDRK-rich factor 1-like [Aquila chrysaetos chrysaetos]|nr:small EDRK-rich factor 1-like [Aquila chrysaetos chrysaetos]
MDRRGFIRASAAGGAIEGSGRLSGAPCVSRLAGGGARPKRLVMTRGNQRELARQKNLKKTQEIHKGKRKEDSLSASQRKQRDSEIMQQKQKVANERKSQQAGGK